MDRALVGNASDREQVQRAKRRERLRAEQDRSFLKAVLQTPAGRRVIWKWIHYFRPNTNLWNANSAQTHVNAALHDAGVYLMAEVDEADPEALLLMMQEDRALRRLEEHEKPDRDMPKREDDRDE